MTQEREAFEDDCAESSLIGWPCGMSAIRKTEYANPTVEDHWNTWQTAWQASRKVALEDAAKALHMVGNGRVFSSEAAGMAAWIKQQFEETIRSLK